jgi:acetyl esterase/lipase
MLSRKDIRAKQNLLLLDHGILPISIDYRLCPEKNIIQGPFEDLCDAYAWAHERLPLLPLEDAHGRPLSIEPGKIAVLGWSTGGMLAMSLAWTAPEWGLPPPVAILAFYCPTDYEDVFWTKPNIPVHSESGTNTHYDLLEGVQSRPITEYNVPQARMAACGWMDLKDARSRLALHMNWRGQTLQVLLQGLPSADSVPDPHQAQQYKDLPPPAPELVRKISPLAHIRDGSYRTPTHILFGTEDDLIPWQQAQRTTDALREAGVECELTLLEGAPHLFDMYRDPDGQRWQAVVKGYDFLFRLMAKQ